MDNDKKQLLLATAVQILSDKYLREFGRHAESDELGEWLRPKFHERAALMKIIEHGNHAGFAWDEINSNKYPNFYDDLWAAIQQIKIPCAQRPDRIVT